MRTALTAFCLAALLVLSSGCGPAYFKNVDTGQIASTDDPALSRLYNDCAGKARTRCPDCQFATAEPPHVYSGPDRPTGPDFSVRCQDCMAEATTDCMRASGWIPCGVDCRTQGIEGP